MLLGGTVIDGSGGTPLKDAVVLIRGDEIIRVGSGGKVSYPDSAKVIDVTGKFILPGLIDVHVHYSGWMGELFLAHGVTTVKDVGNDIEWISAVSAGVEQGRVRGPRIIYVGNGLDAPPPAREHHVGLESPEMARRAVLLLHQRGASAIKVREKLMPGLLSAITGEAHKLGIPVTGHLMCTDAREAALAGINGLEHASGIVQALTGRPKKIEPGENELQALLSYLKAHALIEPAKAEELVRFLASKKVALIPTMANWWRVASERRDDFAREDAEYARIPELAYVPEHVRKLWSTSFIFNLNDPEYLATVKSGYKKLQELLIQHYRAGGKVLVGSDTFSSVPGLSLQRELLLLVDAGFTPAQAITMATRDNAQFLGRGEELGTISPGKLADILVVGANPLADIRNIQKVELVIKDGRAIDRSYHVDYSSPIQKPKLTRPLWIERELQRFERK